MLTRPKPQVCKNTQCNNRLKWDLVIGRSSFVDFQRVRVQEHANEIPAGSLPRTVDVILRHEIVDRAKPGDKCIFTGTLVVLPEIASVTAPGGGKRRGGVGEGGAWERECCCLIV
jgi:DNA replication licensing factor MCM6